MAWASSYPPSQFRYEFIYLFPNNNYSLMNVAYFHKNVHVKYCFSVYYDHKLCIKLTASLLFSTFITKIVPYIYVYHLILLLFQVWIFITYFHIVYFIFDLWIDLFPVLCMFRNYFFFLCNNEINLQFSIFF